MVYLILGLLVIDIAIIQMVKRAMRKFIHISIIILVLVVSVIGVSCGGTGTPADSESQIDVVKHGCEWSETLPESRPSDYNILFKYGYSKAMRNELNTFNGTYTKDMGKDSPITIDFSLSDEDMDRIYQKMVEIDFFCYPEKFVIPIPDGEVVSATSTYLQYYFRVECDKKVKIVQWKDYILKKNEDAGQLRRLIRLIRNIVESKEECRDLPSFEGFII